MTSGRAAHNKQAAAPAALLRQGWISQAGRGLLLLGLMAMVLSTLVLPRAASAAAVTERDARAVNAVIEAQLLAFTAGDAQGAFAHASPAIRTQFVDADNFMSMVMAGYPMLVQITAKSFFVPSWTGSTLLQKVQLRDRAGSLWMATYQLQQQSDGAWRIHGCVVVPDSGKSST